MESENVLSSEATCCDSSCCAPDVAEAHTEMTIEAAPAEAHRIKEGVRNYYAERAAAGSSCCGARRGEPNRSNRISAAVGYSEEELNAVPDGANLGLGCGNPTGMASIPEGATVLDLGSGAGFDCFLAARQVGPHGYVIGVDMTPEMLNRARANAGKGGFRNVEFRLGEIEALPVADASVDVVISNCVINLSPEKRRVFAEAYRVLKPGGRLLISDLALARPLPDAIRESMAAYAGCIAGAELKEDYLGLIEQAGFADIQIVQETDYLSAVSGESILEWVTAELRNEIARELKKGTAVVSLQIVAARP